ncbi:putative FAD-linked oxidoreductase [Colletotrichum sp. SAR 10_65]|nr:putative FAD-linked oxidoreductase [Colletotrichum sp. SAR 10_65]
MSKCDALISAGLSDRVSFPTDSVYNSSIASYWSADSQALHPWCIIQPTNTDEVSRALSALVKTSPAGNWDIAVRGGGHSHFTSNNVAHGVTIDMSRMNSVVYKNCSGTVSIGAGARWGMVYTEIEKYGQTVTGGREGNVGVAGLTLGGGASFHTGNRGFAADDVKNYEVVLADGSIVNANAGENPDLFRALKGGSNNFGIVTRFDMQTFAAAPGGLYGGLIFMDYEHKDAVMKQFVNLIDTNEQHPDDTEVVTFAYSSETSAPMIAVQAVNTAGVSNSTSNVWFSICFHNDIEVMRKMAELYDQLLAELQTLIPSPDLHLTFVSQPLPKHFATKGSGNNVLGLETSLTHNSIIWLGQVQTRTAKQEALAHAKLAATTAELEAFAEANGKATSWRYLNYVNPAQDPIKTFFDEDLSDWECDCNKDPPDCRCRQPQLKIRGNEDDGYFPELVETRNKRKRELRFERFKEEREETEARGRTPKVLEHEIAKVSQIQAAIREIENSKVPDTKTPINIYHRAYDLYCVELCQLTQRSEILPPGIWFNDDWEIRDEENEVEDPRMGVLRDDKPAEHMETDLCAFMLFEELDKIEYCSSKPFPNPRYAGRYSVGRWGLKDAPMEITFHNQDYLEIKIHSKAFLTALHTNQTSQA